MVGDADHAGDLGTRKSRSGMPVMWRSHLIKHGSALHSTIASSGGESGHYDCSARIGGKLDMLTCGSCGYIKRHRKDV